MIAAVLAKLESGFGVVDFRWRHFSRLRGAGGLAGFVLKRDRLTPSQGFAAQPAHVRFSLASVLVECQRPAGVRGWAAAQPGG